MEKILVTKATKIGCTRKWVFTSFPPKREFCPQNSSTRKEIGKILSHSFF